MKIVKIGMRAKPEVLLANTPRNEVTLFKLRTLKRKTKFEIVIGGESNFL